ncbi:ABC transporter ATP-binding protein/permease [Neptunicella marina]|uniref:ATP-binding cassette domain-containing protein n=1 Tax=Neptunicella marina TaxID=2125989 RepID=A0A8J6M105_9ALTE|nr:ATP-binding cassette domain-containing protein [Neptunicella marina]MBC3767900.1 ATP-binding cassette domain-containing protein [Neptunicella marina]
MTTNKKADHERQLVIWLKQQRAAARGSLLFLNIISIASVISQIAFLALICQFAQQLIVEQTPITNSSVVKLVIVGLLNLLLNYIRSHLHSRIHLRVSQQLQKDLQQQLNSRQLSLVKQHSHYYWQQQWLSHIPAVGDFVSYYLPQQLLAGLVPLIVVSMLMPVNWPVALILLISLPIVPVFMYLIGSGTASVHRKHFIALERLGSVFFDRIKHAELIHINQAHEQQLGVLQSASGQLNQRTMKVVSLAFLSTTVLDFFSTIAMALVAVFVGFNLLGEVQIGSQINLQEGLYILLLAPLCFAELKNLGRHYHQKSAAIAAAEALYPILTNDIQTQNHNCFDTIDWQDFSTQQPVISAATLKINKGQHIQLHGASGAGKSVLLEALIGFRHATHRLSTTTALLTQQPVILNSDLRTNLTLDRDITDERLWQVLREVELEQWVRSLANQLDTPMGEHPPMSGGQMQRLSLARVLLSDAEIILLDEPTAHLTQQQHLQISEMLHECLKNKTVIWASHKALPAEWFNQHWTIESNKVSCR